MKVQELFKNYKEATKELATLDKAFENDFENEELEAKLDKYYDETYYPAFMELVNEVMKLTKVNESTARKMIGNEKFETLMNMVVAE